MSDEDHRSLAKIVYSLKGKVVISGYDCPLYQELFADFRRVNRRAYADGARERKETLWMNF